MQIKIRLVFGLFLAISLLCCSFIHSTMAQQFQVWNPPPAQTPRYVQGEIVVKFKSDVDSNAIERFNQEQKVSVLETNNTLGFTRLKTPVGKSVEDMVSIYGNNPDVEYAEPNFIVTAHMVPNDPYYPYQWHLYNPTYGGINIPDAWDITAGDASVIVAVIDTGVAYEDYDIYLQAPDLAGTTFVAGYDFINNDSHPNDDHSHGTHVTGTIAQTTNNSYGVAGVAFQTAIMPVKVLSRSGSGSDTNVANGIQYAVDNGAKVINMSLGGPNPSSVLEDTVKYAYSEGVTIIASAGNYGKEVVGYPAAYEECIAVGATRYDEEIAYYSSYGSEIDLVAPGGDITVDQNDDGYGDGVLQETFNPDTRDPKDFGFWFFQGTSMAAPHVSGVAALVIAKYGDIGPDSVRQILQTTAEDHGTAGWDKYYGWGIVDAYNALSVSSEPDIVVTPTSYDYGNVGVGSYADNTFVVKNEGIAVLSISSTTLVGSHASEFSIQRGGGSFDLNPGETRDVVVRFEPKFAGEKSATLRIASNDPDENPYDVILSGTTSPDIAVTPPSYDYGNVGVGSYADNTFVVKNEGVAVLSVSSTTLVGSHASEFSIQRGGGSFDLNPGETRDVVVRFEPKFAGGKNAALRIASNDPDENPYDVALSGSGNPLKWKFQTGDHVYPSPAIGSDGTIYFGSYDSYLYALNSDSMGLADSPWPKFRHDNKNTGIVSMVESPLYGDVTGDGSVTALDAAIVLQASVGLITLTPDQEKVADVSGKGGVTAYDASLILQYVVGLLVDFPVEGGPAASPRTRRSYILSVGKVSARVNERLAVPISVNDANGILSGKLSLTYDAAYLSPIGISTTALTEQAKTVYNVRDGVLGISFANAKKLNGKGTLLFVEFEARKTITNSIPLMLSEAYLNEGLNIFKVDGWFRFKPETTALLPNFPNPFNPDTWIPYQLKESASVVIRIYNVSGQLVRILDIGHRQPGFYIDKMDAAYWDGCSESGERVASGVYIYQLQAGKFSATRKMVIVK